MNTPSHLVIAAAIRVRARSLSIPAWPFLLGSVMPDIPLTLLSIGGYLFYRGHLGWSPEATYSKMFGELYFTDPWWIVSHHTLHAPLILIAVMGLTWRFRRAAKRAGSSLFWFASSCLIHAVVDILTHNDDGPLLFFPFNWSYRFHSAVSYWDPRHYGGIFAPIELALDLVLIVYVIMEMRRRRRAASQAPKGSPPAAAEPAAAGPQGG